MGQEVQASLSTEKAFGASDLTVTAPHLGLTFPGLFHKRSKNVALKKEGVSWARSLKNNHGSLRDLTEPRAKQATPTALEGERHRLNHGELRGGGALSEEEGALREAAPGGVRSGPCLDMPPPHTPRAGG